MFGWLRKLFPKKPKYNDAFVDAKTPKDVSRIVTHWIGERADDVDEWARPETTWNRGYGDCEDFALLIIVQCRKLNYPCDLYLFWPLEHASQGGHAVTLGDSWIADNGEYFPTETPLDAAKRRAADKLFTKPEKIWWLKVPPERYEKLFENPVDF